ncbi:MAG: alpha/beta hydrolase [Candidatus Omnitrophota bacterium]|jgi:fermentation-respiration switch protein FrsA (DUF1100 family)|nr:MAG: alpha/beta hydrolase [Candidatus Omnitrophota bacterium]
MSIIAACLIFSLLFALLCLRRMDNGHKNYIERNKMVYNITLIVGILIFLVLFLRWFEKANIWIPTKHIVGDLVEIGIRYETIFFNTKDHIRLHGWYVPADAPIASLLFCHGNGGNITYRVDSLRQFHSIGLNTFIFDYRGYGKSEGKLSEKGTYTDAAAAFEWLQNRNPDLPLILFGRSLGAAIAIDLAMNVKANALICESGFTSIADRGQELFPFLPVRLINTIRYDSIAKIPSITIPLLVIHSVDDEIIPIHHGQKLFDAAPEPKEFLTIHGGHNDGFFLSETEYLQGIAEFLKKYLPPSHDLHND